MDSEEGDTECLTGSRSAVCVSCCMRVYRAYDILVYVVFLFLSICGRLKLSMVHAEMIKCKWNDIEGR